MSYQLCKEYPALTPLVVEKESFHRIVKLYASTRKVQMKAEKQRKRKKSNVIYRKAGNDWF